MSESTKAQIIKAGKAHGLFITENSNADHAAKNLLTLNKRLLELENAMQLTDDNQRNAAISAYIAKWWV